MNLNTLPNDKLVSCFESLVRSERKITAQVLECIAEIDRRRLYLKNYTSLFDYLVKDFGYSPGAAMRRIDAARLLRELPETAIKFEKGTLTLTQANQIQRASREFKKAKFETLSTLQKRDLVLQVENTTQKQTEQILASTLDLPVVSTQKETLHRDGSVTLTVTFTKEQIQILEQAQNMVSHSVVSKDWAGVLTHLAKREMARRTNVRNVSETSNVVAAVKSEKSPRKTNFATHINCYPRTTRPAIPASVRKTLLHRNAKCAFKDQHGKTCSSRRFLQIDHIRSWSRGGTHDPQNLQVLCAVHNRLKYFEGAKQE